MRSIQKKHKHKKKFFFVLMRIERLVECLIFCAIKIVNNRNNFAAL